MRNEFIKCTKNYEYECEKHSGLPTEISKLDIPGRSPATPAAILTTPTIAGTLSTSNTPATLSIATTAATTCIASTAATLSTATSIGVSTTNTNFLVENETISRYSDLLIPYRKWSVKINYFKCTRPLELPITKIYVIETHSISCFDYERCRTEMFRGWRGFKDLGYPYIQYNFVIGGDGSIFKGLFTAALRRSRQELSIDSIYWPHV